MHCPKIQLEAIEMISNKQWSEVTSDSFIKWVTDQNVTWAVVTFKARSKPIKFKQSDIKLVNDDLISESNIRNSYSEKDLETALSMTVHQLDFKYIKTSMRKKGVSLKRVAITGGDTANGTWNHIHALIQLPENTSIEELGEYLNKIFEKKMQSVSKNMSGILEASVWCEPYDHKDKFLKYCLRPEGKSLDVKFDKVILAELVLDPS